MCSRIRSPSPPPVRSRKRSIPDLRIHAGSAAADRGEVLPNVNDGYTGAAPDLGAYEAGESLPHYGPRSQDGAPSAPTGLRIVK